jgi:hypothetical protein
VSTTAEFRREQARLAANSRHHPDRADDGRELLSAASRERKLRDILGTPPDGTTWLEQLQREVDDAPPLSDEQKTRLGLLLGSPVHHAGDGG